METTRRSIRRHISTGALPEPGIVTDVLERTHRRYGSVEDGNLSSVYPALERADPAHFGIALVGATGSVYEAGDTRVPFSLMSVAKPFVFALVCDRVGASRVRELVGVDATGLPFNSAYAVERSQHGRTNPMVNAGAIAVTSLLPGTSLERRWEVLAEGLSLFAGRVLALDDDVLSSARETNLRNRALSLLLAETGALEGDPFDATDLYTRQSCLSVTATDLAVMGATLADGGVNPVTGDQVVSGETARAALAVMTVAGLYEASGSWLWDVGLPGKSGIGGGIVTVSPGKGAVGTFSPRLDAEGNSVRGWLATRAVAVELGLDILASEPLAQDRKHQ
ncbi:MULTISPECIES: glutaminase A [unclassified Microbacterium]|uniref:glutaminase A n=1 Tax=unclassified Microbacterium TaxID=2609290 RepID=UPI0030191493